MIAFHETRDGDKFCGFVHNHELLRKWEPHFRRQGRVTFVPLKWPQPIKFIGSSFEGLGSVLCEAAEKGGLPSCLEFAWERKSAQQPIQIETPPRAVVRVARLTDEASEFYGYDPTQRNYGLFLDVDSQHLPYVRDFLKLRTVR